MFKKLSIIYFVFVVNAFAVCAPTGALTLDLIGKIDYSAMFPLRIAGATIVPGRMPDSSSHVGSPICVCTDPFPRIGIPISYFEPSRIIEVVSDSWCFPTFGFGAGVGRIGGGTYGDGQDRQKTFYQAHYLIFPIFSLLELLTDFVCLQSTGADYAYVTEVDPLWNSDTLSAFMTPEALLFGNPIANLACVADSAAATLFNPIDPLFWCKGTWGNAYPLTGWTNTKNMVEDAASVASSMIYKLHRQLILWGSWGQAGLCGYYPAPIWRKSAYRLQLVSPIPSYATTIGTSGLIWTPGHNPPFIGDNFGFMLFKKRDCCVL
ncbi:TraU family protein [Sulfurimonas sp.]|uniref:TraU family protein n=1 Tax=Sulfurimonas sp. TaxID=2022749 RepID=UPI00262B812D|nr:TraU family protein [Sulfurimonas sp.]MDD3450933.1 TraU family protein [Sulfurimonas sp.]